jgi:hypothetical protein
VLTNKTPKEFYIDKFYQLAKELKGYTTRCYISFANIYKKNEKNFKLLEKKKSTKFEREYPPIRFGITTYNPDHSQDDLLIETKFIRKNTTPSVATSGIAEDMTKVPKAYGLLFIMYDPERQIYDDDTFIRDFENRREGCYVRIYR